MPIPSTSDLPKPKSWDEFEDIIWEIYTRRWQDPHAQRYGRSGQPQHGIDIYGQQSGSDNYLAVQCKRYEDNKLNLQTILTEIAKAETFPSPISSYIIATTASRDTKIQDSVRQLNENRKSEKKFSVYVVFWEDVCSYLAAASNHDLLKKYYSEWGKVFQDINGNGATNRKRWRNFEVLNFPVLSNSEASRNFFASYLAKGLVNVFGKSGYTEFVSLVSQFNVENSHPFIVYQIISHKVQFCHTVRKLYEDFIREVDDIKSSGFSGDKQNELKEEMRNQIRRDRTLDDWRINVNFVLSTTPIAHKFIFDPDTRSILISQATKSVWKEAPLTSDLMVMLSSVMNSEFGIIHGIEHLPKLPKLLRLYTDVLDRKPIEYADFRINVNDDEEWEYFAIPNKD
ncbi:hypothetical protein H8E77_29690 [bacterium]|nr:hypothetical protein [bacterium]